MRLFLRQFRWELFKLFSRQRTYLGFAGFLAFEILLVILMQRDDVRELIRRNIVKAGYTFDANFTGPTVAQFILGSTLTVLGALYLALVAGDIVSKEIEDGTMRMVLSHSVTRWRVLLVKILTCAVYTVVLTVFIAITSLAIGLAFEGPGNLFIFNAEESVAVSYAFQDGMMVYFFGALPLLIVSNLTVSAIAFMLSCLDIKPAAATIATLAFFLSDHILRSIPFLASIRHWFLTTRVASWVHIYDERVPWSQLAENYTTLAIVDLLAIGIGWWFFRRRNVKP